mgnify:CR=1 FL=1|jgi:hypothetical protein|uniref:Uncharacterized protein n=1 Tax=viral metagenome TaxID=1070528 RepID=A0A6C0J313_9ZZZZ
MTLKLQDTFFLDTQLRVFHEHETKVAVLNTSMDYTQPVEERKILLSLNLTPGKWLIQCSGTFCTSKYGEYIFSWLDTSTNWTPSEWSIWENNDELFSTFTSIKPDSYTSNSFSGNNVLSNYANLVINGVVTITSPNTTLNWSSAASNLMFPNWQLFLGNLSSVPQNPLMHQIQFNNGHINNAIMIATCLTD